MQKAESRFIFLVIFLLLGIVLAVQFRSTLFAKKQNASAVLDLDKLKEQLAKEQKTSEELKAAIDDNISAREKFIQAFINENSDLNLATEWDNLKLKAGLTDVKGPGITIKLDDAAARQGDTPQNLLIIHDQDIKVILNDLKTAGAQAIAINGERIVSMSEQICAGPTILINGNRYSVPYVIDVIGDPDILYENVSKSERIGWMLEDKIRIEIIKSRELHIPKFSGADKLGKLISGLEVIKK